MRIAYLILLSALFCVGPARAQSPAVLLEAETARTIYPNYGNLPVYLEARILVPEVPEAEAASVRNVAFVLDGSGSMAGEPIQALRRAVSVALGTLADRDVVSVVLFGSEATTIQPAIRRDRLDDLDGLLARIEPAGGAALYDALNQGAAQLRRHASTSTVNHLVLVTDGPATKGPRERDDFSKLAVLFAGEGITVSTIGLGLEFEEDLLAEVARLGHGTFRYAAAPGDLTAALQADLLPLRTPVATEAVLTIEFAYSCEDVETAGWVPREVDGRMITYRFPALFGGQNIKVLAGAKLDSRWSSAKVASVHLRWREFPGGAEREANRRLEVYFDGSDWASRKSINPAVMRTAVGAIISERMQGAIEELDKGDVRRALRELRRARQEVGGINDELRDPEIGARIAVLDAYLAEVRARGLNELDRKLLRSGLHNQFETPTEEPDGQ